VARFALSAERFNGAIMTVSDGHGAILNGCVILAAASICEGSSVMPDRGDAMTPERKRMTPLNFSYNEFADVLTVEGIHYSGGIFREWSERGLAVNEPFFIFRRRDGVLDIGRGTPPKKGTP
jgi:hypothetical protein